MKKFFILSFIFIFLSLYTNISISIAQATDFKEGFYRVDGVNFVADKAYIIQNNSFSDRSFVLVFDSNDTIQQAVRLIPQSTKYTLLPFKPNYKIVIVGNGNISIS